MSAVLRCHKDTDPIELVKPPAIAYVALASTGIPALAGAYFWKRRSPALKVFTALCWLTVIELGLSVTLGKSGMRNYFISDYYRLVEVECLLACYVLWIKNPRLSLAVKLTGISFFLLWLLDEIYWSDATHINSIMAIIARIVIIGATIALFSYVLQTATIPFLQHPMFWIGTGELLYCTGTVLVLAFSNNVLTLGMRYFVLLWYINWGAAIIANLFYTRSYFCEKL